MDAVEQSRSRAGTAYGTLSERALRALLDSDRIAGCVVVSRGNKISRKHYADLLKCSRSALTRFAYVFAEYELQLGVTTGPLRHLPEMRRWLTTAYDNRQLTLRGGKVDRLAFMTHFELRGGTSITRHAPIRKLLEEFDVRAEREAYLPAGMEDDLDRVRSVLADKPVLNKDRTTINLVWLASTARVKPARFREKLFADVLVESLACGRLENGFLRVRNTDAEAPASNTVVIPTAT